MERFKIKSIYAIVLGLALSVVFVTSCSTEPDSDNLFTFKSKTMGQYLKADTSFTEFTRLLDTTGILSLLNSYGELTCFAPENNAMVNYYHSIGKKTLSDFTMDSLKIVAYDHLINGTVIRNAEFITGNQGAVTMSDRYVKITFKEAGTYVNDSSLIIQKDINVYNGIIQKLNKVLNPTREGVAELISKDKKFTLFYKALTVTGLIDSLNKVKDETYDPSTLSTTGLKKKLDNDWYYDEYPSTRKYGFTVFMESDSTFALNQITDIESLRAYAKSVYDKVYPEDAGVVDVKDRRNSLNRFISYHMVDKQLNLSKLIDAYDTDHMIKTRDMYEYIETMCPNTLIEVSKLRSSNRTNQLNAHTSSEDNLYKVVQVTSYNDKTAINGVYHEIDNLLVYNQDVNDMLSTKRLRFEAASFFSELTNNNLRGRGMTKPNLQFFLPRGYISRISSSEQTIVKYLTPYEKYQNYEGDEVYLNATSGKLFDFSIITPPIPAGTYEVRFGYLTNGKRGVTQLYFDGVPAGVPLNLNTQATASTIGYVSPGTDSDDPFGYQNDKMMRNRGYMKGPASYKVPVTGWSYGENSRMSAQILRKVLGTYTFKTAGHHVLMAKALSGGEFMMDYLEFVPTSALETEDIY